MGALVTESGRKAPARLASSAILACQSDERLVELVRDGHERAFEAIVARYRSMLVRFCTGILPESRAEDAVQLAFLNAHSALRTSDDAVQLKPWLFAITRNAALNMLRQNGWNYDQIPDDFDGVMRPDQAVEQKIELQTTVAAVNDLPERQRRALVMRELEGRSYEEIALALAAGDGAVRQLLNRARGTLRSIATALMPPPIVARAAASLPPSDGRRVAEVLGSFGAAGMVKVGASAVVAGTLVVGAVKAPLPIGDHHSAKQRATISASHAPPAAAAASTALIDDPVKASTPGRSEAANGHTVQTGESEHSGRGKGGSHHAATPGADDHRGSSEHRSGSDDHSGSTHSGSDDHSGSGDRPGSDDHSTNSGAGSGSDDSTSGSGGSGSDDSTSSGPGPSEITTLVNTESGSGTSGSGTSGSGTSGSETSGSGTSGSGTSGSGSTESGTSGSGTSGSGSDDGLSSNSGPGSSNSTTTTTTTDVH